MSTPFNIKRTTHVGRNGFDMSQRHLFNAFPGALIPCMCEETLPGDSFRISLDSFTRLRTLYKPSFARFKEYFDFFWISNDTLWPYFNQLVVNNNEPTATSSWDTSAPTRVPAMFTEQVCTFIDDLDPASFTDDMGVSFASGTSILFDMLGYGDFSIHSQHEQGGNAPSTSLLPIAFYQRIYADYYRNPNWEKRDVLSYNLRQFYGRGELGRSDFTATSSEGIINMFKLRYANWNKDYFTGIYPTQQFGDVSVVGSSVFGTGSVSGSVANRILKQGAVSKGRYDVIAGPANNTVGSSAGLEVEFSIVDLRRAQALQRWKEVTMTNGSSMYQQVKAHFGFELPEGRKDASEYIGGFDNVVTISDAPSTSETGVYAVGDLAGRGSAASDPRKVINFDAKDFGMLMCIYHVEPYLDYTAFGIKRQCLKLEASDFYIPEFDRIGFGTVDLTELLYNSEQSYPQDGILGYSSRYLDMKTSYDRVHGSYRLGTGDNSAWTICRSRADLESYFESTAGKVDFRFMKVNPFIGNNVFRVKLAWDSPEPTSPFQVCPNFNIYKTSNMSVDSLPN